MLPGVREALLARGGPMETGFVRHAYRPFDTRWLYWEAETKLLDEKRAEYQPHVFKGNLWLGFEQERNPRRIHAWHFHTAARKLEARELGHSLLSRLAKRRDFGEPTRQARIVPISPLRLDAT